jgi:hypothetical protein
MEQYSDDPRFYRYLSEQLRDDHIVTLTALSDQCEILGVSLEAGTTSELAIDRSMNDYGHVADLCSEISDSEYPLLIGTLAEASIIASLTRCVPQLAPLTSSEREFIRRSHFRTLNAADALRTVQPGRQTNEVLLDASGQEILDRWGRWLHGDDVGGSSPPSHLIASVRLLHTLISDNITFH